MKCKWRERERERLPTKSFEQGNGLKLCNCQSNQIKRTWTVANHSLLLVIKRLSVILGL